MIRAWRNLFKPHILERGLDYYEEEAVVSLEEIAIGYKAVVNGTEEYSVRYALLEAEGMYERLFDEVVSVGYLLILDKYEQVLKKDC